MAYLRLGHPVPAVYGHIPSLNWRGYFWSVCSLRGESLEGSHGPMGRGCRYRVHRLLRHVNHGLGAVSRERALFVVELALLPLVQLPHGVISHGPPLLLRPGPPRLVVAGRVGPTDAFRPGLAVSRECSVTFRVAGHHLGSVAWHISW
jgi:hypothetical protein